MRILKIAPGEHYHIFNRASNKQTIFHDSGDYIRFLFLTLYLQAPLKVTHISRMVKDFSKHFNQSGQSSALATLATKFEKEIAEKRVIELVAFCIMPNHFHLIIKELEENGIATYTQRILTAYAKYYNTKYAKSGHVFQGPYKAVHVENNEQLLHLSAYIHRNPREIPSWFNKESEYKWSSYQDFIGENRWDTLLVPNIILEQFKDSKKYHEFVITSPAKTISEEPEPWPKWSKLGFDHFGQ